MQNNRQIASILKICAKERRNFHRSLLLFYSLLLFVVAEDLMEDQKQENLGFLNVFVAEYPEQLIWLSIHLAFALMLNPENL